MKAVWIDGYGGAEVTHYGVRPDPKPGPGEVLVAVRAASVNPIDWKIRAGLVRQFFPIDFPCVLGRDFSGVVTSLGEGVSDLKLGDEVFGMADARRGGSHAGLVAVGRDLVTHKPPKLSHAEAASLPLAGITALIALNDVAAIQPGQRLLIHAAAGGVGGFAVQYAKHRGAWVAGTCGTANVDYVKALGADRVVDYAREDFTSALKGMDIVFDTMGGETARKSEAVLRPGGCLVQIMAAPVPEGPHRQDIEIKPALVRPRRDLMERIAVLTLADAVRPQVTTILPLAETAKAYELSRTGHGRGKIVIKVD